MIKRFYEWSTTWTGTIIIVLSIIFFVAQAFVIPSGSMKNTLLIGDMLFVKKFSYGITIPRIPWIEVPLLPDFNNNGHLIEGDRPKRGDIVVFLYPKNPKIHFVKRAVAIGGDQIKLSNKTLLLHPKEGNDYVKKHYTPKEYISSNDKLWIINPYKKKYPGIHNNPYIINNGSNPYQLFNTPTITIPPDEFFMMGDNRDHSNDSRFWGTVHYKYVIGKPWFIHFSIDENKTIRWNRMFKTIDRLEKEVPNNLPINHKKGIY